MTDWNPDDPALSSTKAPHETAGVMRMHRAGVGSKEIMQMLKLRGTQLIKALELSTEAEVQAQKRGLVVHDPFINEESA